MLNAIIKGLAGAAREITDLAEEAYDDIVEGVTNIPDAVSEGWNEGLFKEDTPQEKK